VDVDKGGPGEERRGCFRLGGGGGGGGKLKKFSKYHTGMN